MSRRYSPNIHASCRSANDGFHMPEGCATSVATPFRACVEAATGSMALSAAPGANLSRQTNVWSGQRPGAWGRSVRVAAGKKPVADAARSQQIDVIGNGCLAGQCVALALEQRNDFIEGSMRIACEGFEQGGVGALVHVSRVLRQARRRQLRRV